MTPERIFTAAAALFTASLALSGVALAQEETPPAEKTEPAESAESAEPVDKAESAPPQANADEIRSEKKGKAAFPRIADEEETIYAVQRKAYLVNRKIELSLMPSASLTDRFVQTFGGGVSVSFHLAENFGIELSGNYLFPNNSGLRSEILEKGKLTPEIVKLTQMLWGAGLGAQWSPIYGKLEIFDASLGTFSFFVAAGFGIGQTRVECIQEQELDAEVFGAGAKCPKNTDDPQTESEYRNPYEPNRMQAMGSFAGGVRFYFSNAIGLKIEVKDWIFPAQVFHPKSDMQPFTDTIRNNVLVQVGVSFLFGGEEN